MLVLTRCCCRFKEGFGRILIFIVIISSTCLFFNISIRKSHLSRFLDFVLEPKDLELEFQMMGPIPPDDPQLLQYVRKKYLVSPSNEPYVLERDFKTMKNLEYTSYRETVITWMYLNELIQTIFKDEPPGFFVEAGAFDGEYISNTLDLEHDYGWKGLLVEVDAQLFASLLKKNRKAWSSNSCLATSPYPHQTTLVEFTNHRNSRKFPIVAKAYNALEETKDMNVRLAVAGLPVYRSVQCLPLQTLLLAINITHVNFVSLDVEGVEMGILESFLGGRVTVDVWIVEHTNPSTYGKLDKLHLDFVYWFQSKGYTLYTYSDYFPKDYTFIRNESDLYNKVFMKRPSKYQKDLLS